MSCLGCRSRCGSCAPRGANGLPACSASLHRRLRHRRRCCQSVADGTFKLESIASPCELSAAGRATNRTSNGEATSSHLGTSGLVWARCWGPGPGRTSGRGKQLGQRRGPARWQRSGAPCAIDSEGRGRASRHHHGGPPGRAGPDRATRSSRPASSGSTGRQVPSHWQLAFRLK